MKKLFYIVLAISAMLVSASCNEARLDIPQKGVTAIENFYQTDADAESALAAAYAQFITYVPGRGNAYIYTPYKAMLNNGGDDFYAAGSNFGDNDYMAALNEYRFDSGCEVIGNFYSGIFLSVYAANLVIDNFKASNSTVAQKCVAEARVLRAYDYFLLATLWGNPPFVDHVLNADALPYNCDKDPDNPMTHEQLLKWVASECEECAGIVDERASTADKDGAVKVTKGFAWALQGKALLFAGDNAGAKTALAKVVNSGKYALVSGDRYMDLFHTEGDACEEKVFETNIEYNSGLSSWSGINQRSTWMEANIWSWRSDHFKASPSAVYTNSQDGWGGMGVPQAFGDEFFANDGHSYRFDATLRHIDDVVYGMEYLDPDINALTYEQRKTSTEVGISDVKDGLYGQSFWLGLKPIVRKNDAVANYGGNVRMNNHIIMRYAEVLLLYAEACFQTGDTQTALDCIQKIQKRAGSQTISTSIDLATIKNEKKYELWLEGSRRLDAIRWGDTDGLANNGQNVTKLFDKLFREPKAGETVVWENGAESNSRFYTVNSHEAIDAGYTVGYKAGKHEYFPYPKDVMDKNPNIVQNPGY